MQNRITQALSKLFDRHRIIFWYDAKRELKEEFVSFELPEIEKVELANNEFGVKFRILRQFPDQKFLLYHHGPQPADLDNWLLDVQLAYGEFRTDQESIWLSELDLGPEFGSLIQAHSEFFQSTRRKDSLKQLRKENDTPTAIKMKMLAICAGAEPRLDSILEHLLADVAAKRDERINLINRLKLHTFLWEQTDRAYGYQSEDPSIRDFAIELFKSCYAMEVNEKAQLGVDAVVFLKRWKDSRLFSESFETISQEAADIIAIEADLEKRDFRVLLSVDFFKLIDRKIISELVQVVTSRTVSGPEVSHWIRQRRQTHWYQEHRHLYEAIDYANQFISTLNEADLSISSLVDGIQKYSTSWFRLDQLYRKFHYHVRSSREASLMGALTENIENLYSNNYLLKVNDRWQTFIDAISRWEASPIPLQRNFFDIWVRKYLTKDNKVCVIISDALRYEVGDELLGLIRQEDRYEAAIDTCLTMLPSYTQMGMAALLPNRTLTVAENDSAVVYVDGQSSQGTPNRTKLIKQATSGTGQAITFEEVMKLNKDDCRALIRDNNVLYIYHDHIDATGHKRKTEERVFEAAEETLHELIRLIKKLTGANANNILVTADHGFIYQNRTIDDSDFAGADAEGDQILFRDRRFVLGKGLKEKSSLRKFSSVDLGLVGEMEIQLPKSINRLRLKGAGSRFVHGGAALQEVIIPVIKINKKRQSDVATVDVDILGSSTSIISSGQITVAFYQVQPVTDKTRPRELRAGIYTELGELISDSHDISFDLTSDSPRDREIHIRFLLSRTSEAVNGQEVTLRLDEKQPGTTHYKTYQTRRYVMRRSFTSDFDF